MTSFVMLWNPQKWDWPAYWNGRFADQIRETGSYDEPWSTGTRSQGIEPGDRIFLLKTGSPPRGLVASGVARSPIYSAAHWDESRTDLAPQVQVMWTSAADPGEALPSDVVHAAAPSLPTVLMGGGIKLVDAESTALDQAWTEFLSRATSGDQETYIKLRGRRVSRASVEQVLLEYDELGQDTFLTKYGFAPSRRYWLRHDAKLYESKAVLGVAAGLRAAMFSGGEKTTSRLKLLGFSIVDSTTHPKFLQRPSFVPRNAKLDVAPPEVGPRDSDAYGIGLKSHRNLENWLADRAHQAGRAPIDPAPDDPRFDLAWETQQGLTIVEVKSLTSGNETSQLRTALGQVLEYRQQLGPELVARAVIFVEREPSGPHWMDVCAGVGVELYWPARVQEDLFN